MRIYALLFMLTITTWQLNGIPTASCNSCQGEIWVDCKVGNYYETQKNKLKRTGTFDNPKSGVCDQNRCILPLPDKSTIEEAKAMCRKSSSGLAAGQLTPMRPDNSKYDVMFAKPTVADNCTQRQCNF